MINPLSYLKKVLTKNSIQLTSTTDVESGSEVSRAYEGASTRHTLSTWGQTSYGPTGAITSDVSVLRNRLRALVRNNNYIRRIVNIKASEIVGSGVSPAWTTENVELNKELKSHWDTWVDEADYYGLLNFQGLLQLIVKTLSVCGELIVQFVYPRRDSLFMPFQLKLMEPEYLISDSYPLQNNNVLFNGIELSPGGRRVAYHLHREHPDEIISWTGGYSTIRILAKHILHIFEPQRCGQMRGEPELSSVVEAAYNIGNYNTSERIRKNAAACFCAFIYSEEGEADNADLPTIDAVNVDDADTGGNVTNNEDYVATLEPGLLQYLLPGQKVEFSNPVDVGGNYEAWMYRQLTELAAGADMLYEHITGDYKRVSYSAMKSAIIPQRRLWKSKQENILVFQFCRPIIAKWLDILVLSEKISIPDYWENRRKYQKIVWSFCGWDWLDPEKEAKGYKTLVRCGFETRDGVIGLRTNRSPSELDEEQQRTNARADSLGLIYDSDPRKTDSKGDQGSQGE